MEAGYRAFGKRIKEDLINQAPTINLDFMNQSLQNQQEGLINQAPSYRVYSEKSIKSPAIVGNFKPFWSNFGVIIH